jgi:CARDB
MKYTTMLGLGFMALVAGSSVPGGAALAFYMPGKADLVPITPPNGLLFCKSVAGHLKVAVRVLNQGRAYSPASITTVDFFDHGRVNVPTGGIRAGGYIDLDPIDPPAGCFDSDCVFRIIVDSGSSVDESNFGNNSAPGICIG